MPSLISHLHPDHFIDLVPLRHYLRWEARRRVRVIAPEGLADRLDALHDEPGFTTQALDVEALNGAPMSVGDFAIEAKPVTHTDSSFGFRVSVPSDERHRRTRVLGRLRPRRGPRSAHPARRHRDL